MRSYRMYWGQETRIPVFAHTMSRKRFDKLRTMLHINDNYEMKRRDDPNYDELFKVRPWFENFSKTEPEEYNSVDEIMIAFKAHSSLKQYVKNKTFIWGIKTFAPSGVSKII